MELHTESSSTKPDLVFMDQIDEISPDLVPYKNEQCIQLKLRDNKVILTNQVNFIYLSNGASRKHFGFENSFYVNLYHKW